MIFVPKPFLPAAITVASSPPDATPQSSPPDRYPHAARQSLAAHHPFPEPPPPPLASLPSTFAPHSPAPAAAPDSPPLPPASPALTRFCPSLAWPRHTPQTPPRLPPVPGGPFPPPAALRASAAGKTSP